MAAIIFDFDGTIADSFEAVVQIFRELTGHKSEPVSAAEIERLRGLSPVHVMKELHIHPWRVPFLVMRGRRRMRKRIDSIAAHPGMPAVINKLYDEGHQLFVVSSNSTRNIKQFFRQHHLTREFIAIYGKAGLLSKAGLLKKVLRQNSLDPADTWYVGDEVRDVTAAKDANLRVIAVSWGYNNADILKSHQPTALAETPNDIIRILEEA